MGIVAWVFGIIGGACAVMGIVTASEVIEAVDAQFTAMFWLTLGIVLLLACIAAAVSRGSPE